MRFPFRKILCPIDFDENSLGALDKAIELARHSKGEIILVHVVPLVMPFGDAPIPPDLYVDQHEARNKLDDIAQKKLSGVKHQTAIWVGDVVGSILEAIGKFDPDVLVMATHGRGGLAHLFLGSVTEVIVRKATCPVLTVRGEPSTVSGKN
jgi:nucleotide-binding universal stress UspA family protein